VLFRSRHRAILHGTLSGGITPCRGEVAFARRDRRHCPLAFLSCGFALLVLRMLTPVTGQVCMCSVRSGLAVGRRRVSHHTRRPPGSSTAPHAPLRTCSHILRMALDQERWTPALPAWAGPTPRTGPSGVSPSSGARCRRAKRSEVPRPRIVMDMRTRGTCPASAQTPSPAHRQCRFLHEAHAPCLVRVDALRIALQQSTRHGP
jgi:hypothetical protein